MATEQTIDAAIKLFENEISEFVKQQLISTLGDDEATKVGPVRGGLQGPWDTNDIAVHLISQWTVVYEASSLGRAGLTTFNVRRLERTVAKWRHTKTKTAAKAAVHVIYGFMDALQSRTASEFHTLLQVIEPESHAATDPTVGSTENDVMDVEMEIEKDSAAAMLQRGFMKCDPDGLKYDHNGPHSKLVVVDGSNIAWKHGNNARYSRKGILIVRDFYTRLGCRVIIFLPESRLDSNTSMCVDEQHSLSLLCNLRDRENSVAGIPSGDYDDSYILSYARTGSGILVSNDRFRDHLAQAAADGTKHQLLLADFLDHCRVSFTFLGDEFLPDPSFRIHEAFDRAAANAIAYQHLDGGTN